MNDFEELKFLLNGILLEASYSSYSAPQTKVKDIDTFNNVDFKTLEHPKYNGHCVILSTRDLEKISLVNFSKREENIKLKSEKKIQEAKLRLEELNKQKQFIYNFSYEEIVDKLGIERVFNNEKITEDKDFSKSAEDIRLLNFLKFIIKNKYIDDKYSEYTHNLNSSIISQSDIEFIKMFRMIIVIIIIK